MTTPNPDTTPKAYLNGCVRKKRFKTELSAQRRAGRLHMRFYECPICDGWHLTSKERDHEHL
jgi:hypothetical protein